MNWNDIPMAAKLAAVWVLVNFMPARRVIPHARRLGWPTSVWFVVSMLFTAIPFIWAATRFGKPAGGAGGKAGKGQTGGMKRCPHCRRLFSRRELTGEGRCPSCGLTVTKENLA